MSCLLIVPVPRGKVGKGLDAIVENRSVAKGRSDHFVTAPLEDGDEGIEVFPRENDRPLARAAQNLRLQRNLR